MRARQVRAPQLPPVPPLLSSPPVCPPTQTPDETFQNLAWLCSPEAKGLQWVSTAHHIDPDSSVWLPRLFVTRDHPSGLAYCLLLHYLHTHTHTHARTHMQHSVSEPGCFLPSLHSACLLPLHTPVHASTVCVNPTPTPGFISSTLFTASAVFHAAVSEFPSCRFRSPSAAAFIPRAVESSTLGACSSALWGRGREAISPSLPAAGRLAPWDGPADGAGCWAGGGERLL